MSSEFKDLFAAYDTGFCSYEVKVSEGNQTLNRGRLPVVDRLTPVEEQVWSLYQQGKKPKEIAEALGMKSTTVSRRLYTIREKVSCND